MAAEVELDPRHKVLPFKVRAASKEAQPHKAAHILDPDPKSHWSTSTNAKEWLLIELEEPCLLQQIRIHNKSVQEWEISLGLRYKPELFAKVRTRCEAPRRESQYMANYAPCRYVRLSCLRGNPIAIYSVQLIGFSMPGMEPEFQPLVDHLLPHVTSTKHELQDLYLQLLGEIISRLSPFTTYLEGDLGSYNENMEASLRFLAILSGPFYPILIAIDEREKSKNLAAASDTDTSKGAQAALFTVSSNFQAPPRKSRSPAPFQQPAGQLLAFRPDVALMLFRVAYRDHTLGPICRMVSRAFSRVSSSVSPNGVTRFHSDVSSEACQAGTCSENMAGNAEVLISVTHQADYSAIFGEEFSILEDDGSELGLTAILDIASVEEGLLHFLYASVSKPLLCRRLAEVKPDLVPVLPYIQAVLPAMRPSSVAILDQVDESFNPWQSPLIQRVFSQVVSLATTVSYRPLLDACAGYLASFSIAHEKAACILIDLCSGPLAPWLPVVIAKVDLAFLLVEGILSCFQVIDKGVNFARAALIYIILGISGHIDESLTLYKVVKHNIIFVIEMLEPFLLPAITPIKNTIAFGNVSTVLTEKQERNCSLALDILRAAMKERELLSSLELEWRKGVVKPSVLILALAPHLPLPTGLDAQNCVPDAEENNNVLQAMTDSCSKMVAGINKTKASVADDDMTSKPDVIATESHEESFNLFIPPELKFMSLKFFSGCSQDAEDFGHFGRKGDSKAGGGDGKQSETFNLYNQEECEMLQLDYHKLCNYQERGLWAAEFIAFAEGLHLQKDETLANHEAATRCLLLAAECHLNPFMPYPWDPVHYFGPASMVSTKLELMKETSAELELRGLLDMEEDRDKVILQILLKAAEWDAQFRVTAYEDIPESRIIATDDNVYMENGAIDATTLLRKHQPLVLRFLILQLKERLEFIYEALLQGLLFFVSVATEMLTSAEHVVDVILMIAEHINASLLDNFKQKGPKHSVMMTNSLIHRKWALLCRLLAAASGGESMEDDELANVDFECHKELVPASAWMSKLCVFATSPFPLVRFVGWKGLARFAQVQLQSGVVLAPDLQQLSALLALFADDLMCSDMTGSRPENVKGLVKSLEKQPSYSSPSFLEQRSLGVRNCLYPELDCLCPSLQKQFVSIAFVILDAVCSQLRGLPVTAVPDVLSWFSDLCSHPYIIDCSSDTKLHTKIKGFAAANIRYIILQLLEVLLLEYMEALVPELPRVVGFVMSLCESSYCDISLLDAVMKALSPIISYGLKREDSEKALCEEDCDVVTIESLCFDPLIKLLERSPESKNGARGKENDGSCLLFLAGSVLADLSFPNKLQVMRSLVNWANFTAFSDSTSYISYLNAFEKVFETCQFLVKNMFTQVDLSLPSAAVQLQEQMSERVSGPATKALETAVDSMSCSYLQETETKEIGYQISKLKTDENFKSPIEIKDSLIPFRSSKFEEFEECVESLAFALAASLEKVWKLHPALAERLTKRVTQCLIELGHISRDCSGLSSVMPDDSVDAGEERRSVMAGRHQDLASIGGALGRAFQVVLMFQKFQYWQVAICAMEFLLSQSDTKAIIEILPLLCSVLQYQCTHAPRISWREVSVKWLSKVLESLVHHHQSKFPVAPLAQLFKMLMEHMEPEQKGGALQELGKLADLDQSKSIRAASSSSTALLSKQQAGQEEAKVSVEIDFVAEIVDAEWDCVCSLAACDPSPRIRKRAIDVLVKFVPFAQSHHLQRLLSSMDTFLPGLAKDSYTLIDAPVTRLSLALLSRACLYASAKEIGLIPSRVWCSLDVLSKPRNRSILGESEQALCKALLQLRDNEVDAEQLIQNSLMGLVEHRLQANSQFSCVQETVLQVLARINVARMIDDSRFSERMEEAKELREAEIELELIKGRGETDHSNGKQMLQHQTKTIISKIADSKSRREQLAQLQTQILSEELASSRAEISARLERQRLARHNRQLVLEQATLKEMELLQELDREKAIEIEKDIERQRILERERARTKELRHNLELEAERRSQRDLQRELEQRESGTFRPSRREFPGSGSGSRPRERYRERESGRTSQDARSSTGAVRENSTTPPATPTAGSRAATGR